MRAFFMLNESLLGYTVGRWIITAKYILRSSDLEHNTNNILGSSIWNEFHGDAIETNLQIL